MKITIEHSDVKRRQGTLYNVKCAIGFNEEEKAIIRERSLGGNKFGFEHGYVNPPRTPTALSALECSASARAS